MKPNEIPPPETYAHDCDHFQRFTLCPHGWCCSRCRAVRCPELLPTLIPHPTTLGELLAYDLLAKMHRWRLEAQRQS